MPGANWYRDGTVTVTNGSKDVLGSGTIWSVQAKTGDLFALLSDGGVVKFYEIDTVTDNTHLTLKDEFAEATAAAAEYAIIRNFNTTMTSETNAMLVSFLREWKLALQQNLRGDKGDPGDDGNTIYSNNGTPAAGLGTDYDWCLDYSTWNMYRKEAGAWVLRGNIKGATGDAGADGAVWFTAASDPSAATGKPGDYALNTLSGDVFRRSSSGWVKEGNLKGPKGDTGAQGAQGATGPKGDTGTPGSRWHSVTGTPSTSLGVDTDMALDTATGNWYRKESGTWSLKGNIKGPKGDKGDAGDPGVNWRGAWEVSTEYAERDGIYYNGSSFVALQTSTGQTPPDPSTGGDSYWLVVARRGIDGMGAGDMLKVDYDSDADGKVNAAVIADMATYATTAGRATVADSADAADWNNLTSRPESFPPEPHGLAVHTGATLAELNAMITDATIPSDAAATTEAAGLVELATNEEAVAGTDTARAVTPAGVAAAVSAATSGLVSGAEMLTLVHTTIPQSTTATAYDVLATGKIIGRSDWHGPELTVLLRRSGSGQIRVSLSDGTTTVTAETAVFAVAGTDELTLDTTTLADGVTWDLTVEALTDDAGVTVERLKILADPIDEFAPPLVGSGTGNSTNSTSWAELGTSTFLPTWLDVDGRGGVVLLADVDLGTATGAEVRITIGTESVTQAITSNGVAEIHCPFPSVPSAVMSAKIEGKVTGGSGTIALSHWQLHIEK